MLRSSSSSAGYTLNSYKLSFLPGLESQGKQGTEFLYWHQVCCIHEAFELPTKIQISLGKPLGVNMAQVTNCPQLLALL